MQRRRFNTAAAALAASLALPSLAQHSHGGHDHHPAAGSHATPPKPQQMPWGIAGQPRAATRTVQVEMTDAMRFVPDRIAVRQGETLRLVLRNSGKMLHEFVLGTRQSLDAHAAQMLKTPDMAHDAPHMAHVAAGGTGQIVWHFNRAGEFDFACLIAGHYQAGMVGKLVVTPR